MTMITPSYLGETIEYSSLHACRSTLEDPTNRWSGISQQQFRCSFCRNKKPSLGYYTSPLQDEVHAQICEECLAVCRQILLDEAKRDLVAANSAKSS